MALVGWARHPLAGAVLATYAGVILIGSVVLGWHYAIDGYVGGVMAVGIWLLSARLVPGSLAHRDRASIALPGVTYHSGTVTSSKRYGVE